MPQALVTITLLAVAFGLLLLSWTVQKTYLHTSNPKHYDRPWRSAWVFWVLTESAGWGVLALAVYRAVRPMTD